MRTIGIVRRHNGSPSRNAPANLLALLVALETVAGRSGVLSVRQLRDVVEWRSFAPQLLLASLLGFAGRVALGCASLWLPKALLKFPIEKRGLSNAALALKPFARIVDRIICPRLFFLAEPPYSFAIAFACVLLALTVPPLEFVPLVDIPLWGAMVAFSLTLFAHDGVLAIVAFILIAAGIALTCWTLL